MNARIALGSLVLAVLVGTAAPGAHAQVPTGAGWNAWYGCWEPVELDPTVVREPGRSALCIVPGDTDQSVEIWTLEDGVIIGREGMDASGRETRVDRDGCTGTETARWSADRRRLYQSSNLDCPGELERRTSGIFAINPSGEWIASDAITVAGSSDVRVMRYRAANQLERSNREVAGALEGRALAIDAARTFAAAPASLEDVQEAAQAVEVAAVEGWLVEQGHGFDLNSDRLVQLADAGVPEPLIDLIVALSYPDVFAIDRSDRAGERRDDGDRWRDLGPRRYPTPWYFPGYRGGFYPGLYPGYGGGWYGRPVIIVRDPGDIQVDRGGRAVRGQGYTRRPSGGGNTGGSAGPSTSTGGSGGSSGSVGSGGGGGGSDTGRTAKPR